jgi:hypothetical protein
MQVVHPIYGGGDTNIKRSGVVADRFGGRGRRMRAAVIAGGRDPHALAALANGRLRRTRSPLEVALSGPFPAHHARLMQGPWASWICRTGTWRIATRRWATSGPR